MSDSTVNDSRTDAVASQGVQLTPWECCAFLAVIFTGDTLYGWTSFGAALVIVAWGVRMRRRYRDRPGVPAEEEAR